MSVIVTTKAKDPNTRTICFHNGFAWFLDSIFGNKELPANFFSQAVGPGDDPDHGPLTPEEAATFVAALDAINDEELEARMWAAMNGRDPGSFDMSPGMQTIREIVNLARAGDGLVVS